MSDKSKPVSAPPVDTYNAQQNLPPGGYGALYDPRRYQELYGKTPNTEDRLASHGLYSLVAGGGYFPGEKEKLQALMSREIGARSALESQLLNERGASMPGGGSSGFSDNLYTNIAANARQALGQYNLGLEESGQQRRFGALSQLYDEERAYNQRRAQEKAQKRAFWSGLANSVVGGITDIVTGGEGGDNKKKSSIVYKKDVKPLLGKKSSIAYKESLEPLLGKRPGKKTMLAALKSLDLKSFRYKDGIEPDDDGKEHMGVIAEEAPEEIKSGPDKIDLSDTLFMAIGALRELSDKVDQLYGKSGLGALKEAA